jgi:hypothetical protein
VTTALESVHAALGASSNVVAVLGDRIEPKQAAQNETFPYALLDTSHTHIFNTLGGYGGLDICEVNVEVWANTYTDAVAIALTCRRALEAAGFICVGQTPSVADNDVSPPEFCEGWIVQASQ